MSTASTGGFEQAEWLPYIRLIELICSKRNNRQYIFSVRGRPRGPADLLPANRVHPPQHLPLQRAEQEEQAQVRHRLGHLLRASPLKPHPKDLLSILGSGNRFFASWDPPARQRIFMLELPYSLKVPAIGRLYRVFTGPLSKHGWL